MTGDILGIIIIILSGAGIAYFYWADNDRRHRD